MAVRTESLLDKLYNLRGKDSSILREMDEQKDAAEKTKEKTTEQKAILQKEIEDLKLQREELEDQGEKFKNMLKGINRDDYDTVLTRLNLDFDPEGLLKKLNENLPKTIDMVEKNTKESEEELVKVEDEMNRAITTIEELGIRKDTALANQEKLNEYIELALSGTINITRDSITSLLAEFHFTEEEQREAAKILMFPEDALFAYNDKIKMKDRSGKSISQVIQEAKNISEEETPVFEKKVEKTPVYEKVVEEEPVVKEDQTSTVIDTLKSVGIDYLDFTSDEINKLIDNFDKETIISNVNYIVDKNIEKDIFMNHVSMLYDKDLKSKIDLLMNVGKEAIDIYLNPSVLVKYNKEELSRTINQIGASGMDPKNIPLMAY